MAIFVITPLDDPAKLQVKMAQVFPGKHYAMPRGGFLLSAEGTSKTVGEQLELESNKGGLGRVMVTSASGYWGYGPIDMWEWLKIHWGTPQ